MATLRISLKKITSEVKFAERKSALLQTNNVWKKLCLLFSNPAVASPKERLYDQMTSERNIHKANAYLLNSRQEQKSLVTYHTLQSVYVCVWLVNTLTSITPIVSPIICMWSPADVCEQWERNLSFSSADVRGAGTRDEPLRRLACSRLRGNFSRAFFFRVLPTIWEPGKGYLFSCILDVLKSCAAKCKRHYPKKVI